MSAICIPRLRTKRSRKGAAGLVIGYLDIWVSGKAPHQIIKPSHQPPLPTVTTTERIFTHFADGTNFIFASIVA